MGIYRWKHLDDAPWNDPSVNNVCGNEFKASSFGFNIGAGLDYSMSKYISIGIVFDYNIYFPKDEEKFGTDFGAQGNLTPQLKLSYYLPIN
jgi:opacity protein-like surface antigen